MKKLTETVSFALAVVVCLSDVASAAPRVNEGARWRERLVSRFGAGPSQVVAGMLKQNPEQRPELAVIADWVLQDKIDGADGLKVEAIRPVLEELNEVGAKLRATYQQLADSNTPPTDRRWAELYLQACKQRRLERLNVCREKSRRIVFTKHYDMGGSHYTYTEGQSDAQAERHFHPGSSLCLLELDGATVKVHTLLDDPKGVLRDPDVSYDGRRVLFSWKKSLNEDDYHLYEMDLATRDVRQITFGLGFADYEGAYLPNGDIVFNSSRCVQTVDCWWTEVSNLYTCDSQGRYLRRLAYDQVHSNYPTVTPDGRVIYTRWEYSDRGQIFPQSLFEMNADGTAQRELYGNNSWFPTSILHARAIPGTNKIVGIFSGHHTRQRGWLGTIDPTKGRQEDSGAQLIAPVRKTEAVHVDQYGQSADQFQYPYPLSETEFLVAFRPQGGKHFGIYLMRIDGRRELLASDPKVSCNQSVPVAPRPVPPVRASGVDYRLDTAEIYMHDVYAGDGLKGVPRGTIKGLRVVAIDYRAAGVGHNGNRGPAGGALVSTPVSIEGTWDVKKVLGTVTVHEDGSAYFTVPARTPIYFQALDAKGYAVQSMRSWMTLQPGEKISCIGCHDNKNVSPPSSRETAAATTAPEHVKPWRDRPRGLSFVREIQPILDKHCVRCHDKEDRAQSKNGNPLAAFSLKGTQRFEPQSLRKWSDSYKALANRRVANWINIQSGPARLPPYHAGASQSRLIEILDEGHYDVKLSDDERSRFVTWIDLLVPYCGDYREGLEGEHLAKYQHFLDKRKRWEAQEAKNIEELIRDRYGVK